MTTALKLRKSSALCGGKTARPFVPNEASSAPFECADEQKRQREHTKRLVEVTSK